MMSTQAEVYHGPVEGVGAAKSTFVPSKVDILPGLGSPWVKD
jgi:hypothetical protein